MLVELGGVYSDMLDRLFVYSNLSTCRRMAGEDKGNTERLERKGGRQRGGKNNKAYLYTCGNRGADGGVTAKAGYKVV